MTMVTISPRQEEVLSYLCGLAPIGEPVQVISKWLHVDLPRMDQKNFCQFVRKLIRKGAIEVAVHGAGATPSVLRVLKRPEAFKGSDFAEPERAPNKRLRFAGYDATEVA